MSDRTKFGLFHRTNFDPNVLPMSSLCSLWAGIALNKSQFKSLIDNVAKIDELLLRDTPDPELVKDSEPTTPPPSTSQ
jgi:hypothetical protein